MICPEIGFGELAQAIVSVGLVSFLCGMLFGGEIVRRKERQSLREDVLAELVEPDRRRN